MTIIYSLFLLFNGYSQKNDHFWKKLCTSPHEYHTIVDSFNIYLHSAYPDSIPSDKMKNVKDFHRFVYFWGKRLGEINDSISYKPYSMAAMENSHLPFCTETDQAQWELKGPSEIEGMNLGLVAQVLYDQNNPGSYVLSSDHGGLWKNQETGQTWINTTDILRFPGLSATEIIRNPFNDSHLFASTGSGRGSTEFIYGGGILESYDNGSTWNYLQNFPLNYKPVLKIIYDPNDNSGDELTLFAIFYEEVYYSTDSGESWSKMTNQPPILDVNTQLCDIEINSNGEIFATSFHPFNSGAGGQVFRCQDINGSWEDISQLEPFLSNPFQKALISKPYNGKVFLLTDRPKNLINGDPPIRRIYKSTDNGTSWEEIFTMIQTGFALMEYSPETNIVYIGHNNLWMFKNEGNYDLYSANTGHWDVRDIDFMGVYENSYENILVANDGGIAKVRVNINDLSDTDYDNLNGNHLPIGNFLGIGVNNNNSEFIIGGAVHCNSFRYENGNWIHFDGGDGGDSEINRLDPDYYYFQNNGGMKSWNGNNFTTIYSNMDDWFIGMEYELHPFDPYLVYFGRAQIKDSDGTVIIPAKLRIWDENNDDLTVIEVPYPNFEKVGAIGINNDDVIFMADYSNGGDGEDSRLLKYNENGGVPEWTDLSLKMVHYSGGQSEPLKDIITWTSSVQEILFNPDNTNEVWISISGVRMNNQQPEQGILRVLHSNNCGEEWYDYSEGLSSFPVMALEYHMGSNGRIFAGTDAGVFYRDPTMDQWECFSNGLPVSIITDLDYDPCSNYLYASTYSRAIFRTPVLFSEYNPIIISNGENITWDDDKNIFNDVIVQNNATLTIKSNVYFVEGKKIIVERGGNLILDGGVLSNYCGLSWDGIELHGNALEPQNSGNQGMVNIRNGATIKNAVVGIKTIRTEPISEGGEVNYAYTGGIVLTNSANFINNHIAVEMYPYQFESISSFTKSTFKVNDEIIGDNWVKYYVKLTGIDGIMFKGNSFIDERNSLGISHNDRPTGIRAENSRFTADHICIDQSNPCQQYIKNSFINLNYGIDADGTTLKESVTIMNSLFEDNFRGIYLCNIDNATVNLNLFKSTSGVHYFLDEFIGLYLDACNGYMVEENTFINYEDDSGYDCIGIIVSSSGEDNNMIYNNFIDGMTKGIQAQYCNKGDNTGLQLKCNDIRATDIDMIDYDIFISGENDGDGIAEEQGANGTTANVSANNQFNNKGAFGTDTDIRNESETIDYYWYPPNYNNPFKPRPIRYSNIEHVWETQYGLPWTPTEGCPSNITSGGSSGELSSTISSYTSKTDSVASLIQSIEDGGNTDELNTDVQTSTPDQSYEIYSQLINESPDLSDSVMVSSIKKENVLSNAMVTEILAANPQAPKSDTINQALDERINQLSDEQRAEINQGLSQLSEIEKLNSLKYHYNAKRSYYVNSLLRLYKNDTVNPNTTDSVIHILQNEDRLYAKYALAFEYLAREDTTSVLNTLDSIETVFNLNSNQTIQRELYEDYFGIYFEQLSDNETIYEIDSSQKADLYTILNSATGKLKSLARSLLIITDTLTYNEPVLQPDPNKSAEIDMSGDQGFFNYKANKLFVYPNPAKNYVIIESELPIIYNNSYLVIYDITGTMINKIKIDSHVTRKIINTDEFSSGQYIVSLLVNDKTEESVKFTITK